MWGFCEVGKLVSLAVEAGRVSRLAGEHHGSLRLLLPGFCSVEVEQRQEDEWVMVSCSSGIGFPVRPRNLEVFQGSHTSNNREMKDLLQVTREVCGGASFLILNQDS